MRRLLTFALLALPLLLTGCGESQPSPPARKPPPGFLDQEANVAAGARLFAQHCARCHGKSGEGRSPRAESFHPPAPTFAAPRYRSADPAYLYWRIARGKTVEPYRSRGSVMPAWEPHFREEQIWQLVAYLRSRPPA